MKTKEELNTIKKEYEALTNKLKELNEDELMEITGGIDNPFDCNGYYFELDGRFKAASEDRQPVGSGTGKTLGSGISTSSQEEQLGGKIIIHPSDEYKPI